MLQAWIYFDKRKIKKNFVGILVYIYIYLSSEVKIAMSSVDQLHKNIFRTGVHRFLHIAKNSFCKVIKFIFTQSINFNMPNINLK